MSNNTSRYTVVRIANFRSICVMCTVHVYIKKVSTDKMAMVDSELAKVYY